MPEANLFLMFTQQFNTLGVAYMVSGSVAVIIYGEPWLTHDVDLLVVLDGEQIARLSEVFQPAEFNWPPTEVTAVEAARERFGHNDSNVGKFAKHGRPIRPRHELRRAVDSS